MKQLLILLALLTVGYLGYGKFHQSRQIATDPYYVEIRISIPFESINLVGFGLMHSLQECQAESRIFWQRSLDGMGDLEIATDCKKELPERYQKLFANQQFSATYLSLDSFDQRERDARLVIYGIPASLLAKECDKLISQMKRNYHGTVQCIAGSVG